MGLSQAMAFSPGMFDATWLQPTQEPTLLLITCSDENRRVVYAEREN